MLFCSYKFAYFFFAVFLLYWAVPWQRARVGILLVASFGFYASWNEWLALLICISTALDYTLARCLDNTASPVRRKLLLAVSLTANLGLLFYFKYANFFLSSLETTLRAAGASASLPVLQIILPIGISFYTFEAISYLVDVYRRRIPAERNLAHFMLFILFFPHLIAGPIVRARDFLPQIRRPKRWDWARLQLGVQFFLMGMFKKLAIADRMAMFADPVYADPSSYQSSALWIAALAYAIQIYCDFSGYSDMALGTAHMLGYKLARNFNMPYLAPNMAEFWQRWHISLSSWLRDYVFFPLGGSRGGIWRTSLNLMIVFTLCGLWHGASVPCLCWGIVTGLLLVIHRWFRGVCDSFPRLSQALQTAPGTVLRIAVTFTAFTFSLVVFRTSSLSAAGLMLSRLIFRTKWGQPAPLALSSFYVLAAVVVICHVLGCSGWGKRLLIRMPAPIRGLGYAAVMTLSMVLAVDTDKAFIYFQF